MKSRARLERDTNGPTVEGRADSGAKVARSSVDVADRLVVVSTEILWTV